MAVKLSAAPGRGIMAESLPTADWYPDPDGEGGERYWDGQGWTKQRRSNQLKTQSVHYESPGSTTPLRLGHNIHWFADPVGDADWYADPGGSGGERFWDGHGWTTQRRGKVDAVDQELPVLQSTELPEHPVSDIPPDWYPDPDGEGGERYWDRQGWTKQRRSSARPEPPSASGSHEIRQTGVVTHGSAPIAVAVTCPNGHVNPGGQKFCVIHGRIKVGRRVGTPHA
jgi:hypothetical protein